MATQLQFETRNDFRSWLAQNCQTSEGIWIIFYKAAGKKYMSAADALEEALCYGWIDGQIKSIDDTSYLKYFSRRSKKSEWSAKNKKIVDMLEASGKMTDHGRAKIEEAKQNNHFGAKERVQIIDDHIEMFCQVINGFEPAYTNFLAMSPSVKRTYTMHYFDAKSESTRNNRLGKIIERLNNNQKPM